MSSLHSSSEYVALKYSIKSSLIHAVSERSEETKEKESTVGKIRAVRHSRVCGGSDKAVFASLVGGG